MTLPLASKAKEKTKVVVRKLPPAMSEDAFNQVLQGIAGGQYNWLSYYQGKASAKKLVFSRAYINFVSSDAVFEFKAKFDGHVFVSTRGTQYKCAVEYAPFQKVPSPEAKKHALEGTIEQDPDYIQFLELLEQGPEMLPSAAAQREADERDRAMPSAGQDTTKGGTVTSRLMEYLTQKYAEAGRLGGLSKAKQGKREQVREASAVAAPSSFASDWRHGREADESWLGSARGAAKPSKLLQREGRTAKAVEVEPPSGRPAKATSKAVGRPERQQPRGRPGDEDGAAAAAAAAAAAVAAAKHAEQQSVMAVAEAVASEGRGGRGRPKGASAIGSAQPLVEKPPAAEVPKMLLMKSGQRKETQAIAGHTPGAGASVAGAGTAAPKAAGQGRAHAAAAAGHGRNAPPATDAAPAPAATATAPSAKAPATRKPAKPSKAEAEAPVARSESSGASSAPAAAARASSAAQSKAAAVATPALADGTATGGDPAAAAAAAATAALAARPAPTKKVRAGFQAYVPGSMRNKGGGSGGGADTG